MIHPKRYLDKIGHRARKRFSQNFLIQGDWPLKLTRPVLEVQADEIWEIGPGLGALTSVLLEKAKVPLKVFEIDRDLIAHLKTEHPKLELIEGDFLKADIETLSEGKKIALVSNLPYHISSPIFFKLLENRHRFTNLVLTFQREFSERLSAKVGTKAYGATSVLAQYCFDIRVIGNLPIGAFFPAPKVISQAIELIPKPDQMAGFAHLSKVVKASFVHRRKKLINNLKKEYPAIQNSLEAAGIEEKSRAENLSLDQFVTLTQHLGGLECER